MTQQHRRTRLLVVLATFLPLFGLTLWLWQGAVTSARLTAADRFDFKVREASFAIRQRLLAYEHMLRGGVGLFAASQEVTRTEWRRYVAQLQIDRQFPGIRGIGFALRVPAPALAAHLDRVRAEGFSDYRIWPVGERAEYSSIIYLEPFDWRNQRAFGYDMMTEPIRRQALGRARDSGQATVSGRVTLVQETEEAVQQGFLMYLPVYPGGVTPATVAERRAQLIGYVYAPFRMNDLMQGILGREALPRIDLEIYDGASTAVADRLYDSDAGSYPQARFRRDQDFALNGHRWTLRFTAMPAFEAGLDRQKPLLLLVTGTLISLLFAAVAWALVLNRQRSRELARSNTELQQEILDHQQAEAALKREHARSELLEESLRRSQKLEAIGTLAAGIAHDFNNILGSVLGYTELSLDDLPADSQPRRNLQQVMIAGLRARDLVAQIMVFARQDDSQGVNVLLAPIVHEVAGLLRGSLPEGIELHTEVHAPAARVLADPTQLSQVLMNLGVNASYAMRERGGRLSLMLDEVELDASAALVVAGQLHPGRYCRLTVRDNGVGIAPELLDRIFDPFFTTKPVGEGSGLGLSVVHGVVSRYGGHIEVHSAPGQGACFEVYLPAVEAPAESVAAELTTALVGGSGHILFVDDEPQLAEVGQQMLRRLGYTPVVCTNPREALTLFRADPGRFVAVVTDQTMPELTGCDLARELLRFRPDTPIVLCTGFSHMLNADRLKAIGIRGFLAKPVSLHALDAALQRALEPALPA